MTSANGTWRMEAILRLSDLASRARRATLRDARRRAALRDAALLTLRAAGIQRREILRLRGRDVQQADDGRVYVWLVSPSGTRRPELLQVAGFTDAYVQGRLLEYLREERLMGEDRPLFAGRDARRPIALSNVWRIERKHRGCR